MIKTVRDFTTWPRTKGGDPIFTESGDAIFYAHLIINNSNERLKIARLKQNVASELILMRSKTNPNLDHMMGLAVKGQFYRECLEEIERIVKEVPN